MELSTEQRKELEALEQMTRATGKPSFQHKLNWSFYQPLVDAGLVVMGPHPDFGNDFKAVSLTPAGLAKIGR